MADVHLPHLDEPEAEPELEARRAGASTPHRPRGGSIFKILLEVVLISTGVFLGLAGEQWREHARNRELAEMSLRRFSVEIQTNRNAVADVEGYHARVKAALDKFLPADAKTRKTISLNMVGFRPVNFEHSAWDLAVATQALTYMDAQLAFDLSHLYTYQQSLADLTRGLTQAMYVNPPTENLDRFLRAVYVYYQDMVIHEPALIQRYDVILRQIDAALGESSPPRASSR